MRRVGLIVGLLVCVGVFSSCATLGGTNPLGTDIQTAEEYCQGASTAIEAMQVLEAAYFALNPNPALQAKIDNVVAQVKASLSTLQTTLAGAQDINSGDVADAFTAFESAYNQLIAQLNSLGVSVKTAIKGTKTTASPTGIVVPAARSFAPPRLKLAAPPA